MSCQHPEPSERGHELSRDAAFAGTGGVTAGLVEQVRRFDGSLDLFLRHLLAIQCEAASADEGAVVRAGAEGLAAAAVHPEPKDGAAPPWLARCMEAAPEALRTGESTVVPLHGPDDLYGQPARRRLVIIPLRMENAAAVAGFVVRAGGEDELAAKRERLELTGTLCGLYEMRLAAERGAKDLARLHAAMTTLAAINESERFAGTAMALCNEIAARWRCERVGLGFLKGRYVKLKALSHTEKFSRKMKLVQDIEAAMEECIDQDVEVAYPAGPEAAFVLRATQELSTRHGPTAVLSLPLRRMGEPAAVLTLERAADEPFTPDEIETLRLACDLCAARVLALEERDRWFGARAAGGLRKGLATVIGPKHTWAKLVATLVLGAIIFLVFARGTYRVEAPFVIEAVEQQVVPAPFDGYLKTVLVEPGSIVRANDDVLATLDTAELRLELAAARAELAGCLKQVAAAMRDDKTAEAQIAQARADKTAAEISLLEHRIAQAKVASPLAGVVVKGDLKRQIGAPVKQGEVLFEVAPLESLRAVLSVPEDSIADVIEADRVARAGGGEIDGRLATAGHPEIRLPFVVERINPLAEVVKDRNVFKVRVRLTEPEGVEWLRPGMEGAGRIDIEKRSYAWIWTRRLVNWVRMKLWL
jgi:multidrug resistance efflux pump